MISINSLNVKSIFSNIIIDNELTVNKVNEDINEIKNFSDVLEVTNITKTDSFNSDYNILYLIKLYESIYHTNNYSDFKCPLCKQNNCLSFHKTYQRNIIFYIGEYEITAKISLITVECSNCKQNKDKQRYHALIPEFIFPYHTFSSYIIIDCLYDRLINNVKINIIIEKIRISHQLFFKWLKGLKKYIVPSSVILEEKAEIKIIISNIKSKQAEFLFKFYSNYNHPFFLFKITCVPLTITL